MPTTLFIIKEVTALIRVLQKDKVSKTLTYMVTEAEKFIQEANELKNHRRFCEIYIIGHGVGKPGPG